MLGSSTRPTDYTKRIDFDPNVSIGKFEIEYFGDMVISLKFYDRSGTEIDTFTPRTITTTPLTYSYELKENEEIVGVYG